MFIAVIRLARRHTFVQSAERRNCQGVVCAYCGKRTAEDQAAHSEINFFCEACISSRFTPPSGWKCVECGCAMQGKTGREVLGSYFYEDDFACASCGSEKPFTKEAMLECDVCKLPVFDFQHFLEWRNNSRCIRRQHQFCSTTAAKRKAGCMTAIVAFLTIGGVMLFISVIVHILRAQSFI